MSSAITCIYRDEYVLVVNKPAGILVHPDGKTATETVADWVRANDPALLGVGEPIRLDTGDVIQRPGIVHRLDRDTSGVLVLARSREAYGYLKAQFQAGAVSKAYRAFVYGVPDPVIGHVDAPIGRSRHVFTKRATPPHTRGTVRSAFTSYRVLEAGIAHAYLALTPQTGRTHQLRVHCAALHHPIVCDPLYAANRACALGFRRLALHAASISFEVPSGLRLTVEAPEPDDFQQAHEQLAHERSM